MTDLGQPRRRPQADSSPVAAATPQTFSQTT